MKIIEHFLNSFKQDYLSNTCQYGNNVYISCLNDLFAYARSYEAPDCDRVQIPAEIKDKNLKSRILDSYGIVLSYYKNNGIINRPTQIRLINNRQYVSAFYSPIRIFDDNWSYLGDIPAQYHNSPDGYVNVRDFDIDLDNNIIWIACYYSHAVKGFDLTTGELKYTIGQHGHNGDMENGYLFYPIFVRVLSNHNVIVGCASGRGYKDGNSASSSQGHISEFDSTGGFINTRLQYDTNGHAQSGEVYRPRNIYIDEDNDDVFVCYPDRGYIGRFRLVDQTYKTVYTLPAELQEVIVAATPISCTVKRESNELIVANDNPDIIASIDLDSHDLNYYLGQTVWNDRRDQKNIIAGFYSIFNIHVYDSSTYVVVDYGNNCIQFVPVLPYLDVEYDFNVPDGYKVNDNYVNHVGLNVETKTIRYSINHFYDIKDLLHLPLEKIEDE